MEYVDDDLHRLIIQGEGETLDFKFRIDDQRKIARTLVAFANTKGGTLLIGVKDNGKITGVNPEEEFHMIKGAADVFCRPELTFRSEIWKDDRHLVLIITVNRGEMRYKAQDDQKKWVTYYRIADKTVQGNKVLDKCWVLRKKGFSRPECFSDIEINLIRLLRERGELSFSSLAKLSGLSPGRLADLLASLIVWDIILFKVHHDGIFYLLRSD